MLTLSFHIFIYLGTMIKHFKKLKIFKQEIENKTNERIKNVRSNR